MCAAELRRKKVSEIEADVREADSVVSPPCCRLCAVGVAFLAAAASGQIGATRGCSTAVTATVVTVW